MFLAVMRNKSKVGTEVKKKIKSMLGKDEEKLTNVEGFRRGTLLGFLCLNKWVKKEDTRARFAGEDGGGICGVSSVRKNSCRNVAVLRPRSQACLYYGFELLLKPCHWPFIFASMLYILVIRF